MSGWRSLVPSPLERDAGEVQVVKASTTESKTGMSSDAPNQAQIDYWNAGAGETWAALNDRLDRQLAPLGDAAMEALALQPGDRVLDVGCGCGHSSLALARAVGGTGQVTGIDVSRPMLDVARRRVPEGMESQLEFLEADAQSYSFETEAFDAVYSRFGVMFFADPAAAFRNLTSGLALRGRLSFVCWRSLAENAWMAVPRNAGLQHLPPAASGDPSAPGPFAFADARRIEAILVQGGYTNISISPFDTDIVLGRDLDEAVGMALKVGPLGAMLRETPQQLGTVSRVVREALTPYVRRDGVLLPAATWIVTANRASAWEPG